MEEQIQQAEAQFAALSEFLLSAKPRMTGAETNVLKVNLEAIKSRLNDVKDHHQES